MYTYICTPTVFSLYIRCKFREVNLSVIECFFVFLNRVLCVEREPKGSKMVKWVKIFKTEKSSRKTTSQAK